MHPGQPEGSRTPPEVARQLLERVRREEPVESHLQRLAEFEQRELEMLRTDRIAALAFWLNIYNAATQLLLVERPGLFDSRWRFFRTAAITIADVPLSLDDIEHGILRGNRSKYGLGYLPRIANTGLESDYQLKVDPRIHFALNCGAASCPAILAYEAEQIDDTLDEATQLHLDNTVTYNPERNRMRVPRVCLWFIGDFGGFSGLKAFLRDYGQIPDRRNPSIRFQRYDWTKRPRRFISRSE